LESARFSSSRASGVRSANSRDSRAIAGAHLLAKHFLARLGAAFGARKRARAGRRGFAQRLHESRRHPARVCPGTIRRKQELHEVLEQRRRAQQPSGAAPRHPMQALFRSAQTPKIGKILV